MNSALRFFERTKRYVALTELGRELLDEALTIIESVDRVATRLRDQSTTPRGRLRVGSIAPATIGLIPRILPRYRERYPNVDLVLDTIALDEHVPALIERRIDVSIMRGPIANDRIWTTPIVREHYCIVVPETHTLASAAFVSLSDLKGVTLIWLRGGRGGSFNASAFELLDSHNIQPGAAIEASDLETSFALVASNAGLSLASTIISRLRFEGTVYRPLVPAIEIGTMVLACRRDRRMVPVIASMVDHITELDLTFTAPAFGEVSAPKRADTMPKARKVANVGQGVRVK